ncbi:hypothetical protein CDHC01_1682 [Corynebacterium diphtheriae HC01]|uniref:Pyridoxal phosphate homeostasis protein n=2 Tax=Corynebacterium diphtheriae TaxID=1717 RepID=Q6NFZ0_CORDI|nr:YggS family pyridoxal phosphate-dependent enzyme [Corynebacterium diphtheriae]OWN37330.1 alanine racemase [Corynebacterium belfantii]AEX44736.1 hypothetical protein CD241_1679 [Corynebacterium diphtheriae 241]AEX74926.1 hypothetical protein CDHC01_1682 [Corynebacterium diphtheriae HC01]APM35880.1 YggS family pyridoxal phosphate enzyme [Corynebacterium diphtheriae]ARB87845.1 YggS family pyridoxal phosphate-dependent enzyme [Corynebacterium diphtheriae]
MCIVGFMSDFRTRYQIVSEKIAAAAQRSGRKPSDIRLIAVSKNHPVAAVQEAMDAGVTVFGENRPQELVEKAQAIPNAYWCAIGRLQRNKAKDIVRYAQEFHALDSLRLAQALDQRLDHQLDVFVQVNTSHEEQKGGIAPSEVEPFLAELSQFSHLHVRGLMTMARNDPCERVVRASFSELRELRDALLPHGELSMGMSGDFEWAIEEGATSVRVGSALFL